MDTAYILAGGMSFVLPGLGQLVTGRAKSAARWALLALLVWFVPAWLFVTWEMAGSTFWAPNLFVIAKPFNYLALLWVHGAAAYYASQRP